MATVYRRAWSPEAKALAKAGAPAAKWRKVSGWHWVCEWQVRDVSGMVRTERTTHGRDKAAADRKQREIEGRRDEGSLVARADSWTVAEAGNAWVKDGQSKVRAGELRRSSIEQRRQHVERHIAPYAIGGIRLSELTADDVKAWLDELREAGLSLPLRRKVRTSLVSLIKAAPAKRKGAGNPAAEVPAPGNGGSKDVEPLTTDELTAVMAKAPRRWRPFLLTAVYTGARLGELRGLRWADIDLDEGTVTIAKRADAWGALGDPKSGEARTLPLARIVVEALLEWRDECPRQDGELVFVFPDDDGKLASSSYIYRQFWWPVQLAAGVTKPVLDDDGRPVLDRKGGPKVEPCYGFHAVRHTAASLWFEAGEPIPWVSKMLGHRSPYVTMTVYAGLLDKLASKKSRERLERMQAALSGSPQSTDKARLTH